MLNDILDFAVLSLTDNSRLSFWMPTSNDEDQEIKIPEHPCLEIVSVCTQSFNRWSRRLITYRRIPDSEMKGSLVREEKKKGEDGEKGGEGEGRNANDLNPFRRGYFGGFKAAFR